MSTYIKVHIQFEHQNNELGDLKEHIRSYYGNCNFESAERVIAAINNNGRRPRLEYPTYVSNGAQVGDFVSVPYGSDFYPIGLVVGEVAESELVPNVAYKPVKDVLGVCDDKEELYS